MRKTVVLAALAAIVLTGCNYTDAPGSISGILKGYKPVDPHLIPLQNGGSILYKDGKYQFYPPPLVIDMQSSAVTTRATFYEQPITLNPQKEK